MCTLSLPCQSFENGKQKVTFGVHFVLSKLSLTEEEKKPCFGKMTKHKKFYLRKMTDYNKRQLGLA